MICEHYKFIRFLRTGSKIVWFFIQGSYNKAFIDRGIFCSVSALFAEFEFLAYQIDVMLFHLPAKLATSLWLTGIYCVKVRC